MKLLKTVSLSLLATFFKIISALVINKFVSLYIGPTGVATLGQLQNFIQITNTISSAGLNGGIVSLTSKYKSDIHNLERLWSNVFSCIIILSVLTALFVFFFSIEISNYIFSVDDYSFIFVIFSFTLLLNNINLVFLSIINGLKEVKKYISLLITQSIYSLIITSLMIYLFRLDGALLALVTSQVFVFFLSFKAFISYVKKYHVKIKFFLSQDIIKQLSRFGFMAITSAIVGPVSFFIIRNYLGSHLGWDDAGYWQSMWYISSMYLLVITGTLSTYYLPRLSEINQDVLIKKELLKILKLILPVAGCMSIGMFLLKEWLIFILFSEKFLLMLPLFKWQLIGDIFKIVAWAFSYILIAKAKSKIFILIEVAYFLIWTMVTLICIDKYALIGTSYSYALINFIYLICISSIVLFILNKKAT